MNPDLATFLTGLACLAIGWLAFDLLIHRPSRRAADAEHTDLLRINAEAADDLIVVEARADVWIARHKGAVRDKARLVIALDNARADLAEKVRACAAETERMDRRYWMPTLDGIRADSRDNPPDAVALAEQFRKDFEAAEVVPIKGKGGKR